MRGPRVRNANNNKPVNGNNNKHTASLPRPRSVIKTKKSQLCSRYSLCGRAAALSASGKRNKFAQIFLQHICCWLLAMPRNQCRNLHLVALFVLFSLYRPLQKRQRVCACARPRADKKYLVRFGGIFDLFSRATRTSDNYNN